MSQLQTCRFTLRHLLASLTLLCLSPAHAGVQVSVPNGYLTVSAEDMRVQSLAGPIVWSRSWDGREWKFNPHWESLSQSFRNLTGSQSAAAAGGSIALGYSSSGGSSLDGCWVLVDEDWSPSYGTTVIGGALEGTPLIPERSTPFNRSMSSTDGGYPASVRVSLDYANLCPGMAASFVDAEAVRRLNNLYLGEGGRLAHNNRNLIQKRAVRGYGSGGGSSGGGLTVTQPATNPAAEPAPAVQDIPQGWRWSDRDGAWIDYDAIGRIVAYGDANNNTVWLQRDAAGRITHVRDANHRLVYSLHYSTPQPSSKTFAGSDQPVRGELLTEVRDYSASSADIPPRSIHYGYDDYHRLTSVTDPLGHITRYSYDAANRLISITDAEGRIESIAYKGDIVSQRTAPDGGITDYRFDYDDANKQFISQTTGPETEAGRRVEVHSHNRAGQLLQTLVNARVEAEVRYDTGARTEIVTNARGFVTQTVRNEFDIPVKFVNEDGSVSTRTYSPLNMKLVEYVDESGRLNKYEYDARGNRKRQIEAHGTPEERVTEYVVDEKGQVVSFIKKGRVEFDGRVTPDAIYEFEYDELGQISKTKDPEGGVKEYVFDRLGNLSRYTDEFGRVSEYKTDEIGRLVERKDALGRRISFKYDRVGNVVETTDAKGVVSVVEYDRMNRVLRAAKNNGDVMSYEYDARGALSLISEGGKKMFSFGYDGFDKISASVDALNNRISYDYSAGGEGGALGSLYAPTQIQYPSFKQQSRFDARERLTLTRLIDPSEAQGSPTRERSSSRAYDRAGRLIRETDAKGKTRHYAYDALGQLIEVTDTLGSKTKSIYDVRGNLIALTDAKGNTTKFEYDRNDRLVKETLPLGQTTRYEYDAAGNLATRIDPLGNQNTYQFDAANRLTELKQYRAGQGGTTSPDPTLVRTTTYTWNETDQLTGWIDIDSTRPTGQQTASAQLTYDDAGRKTGETISYPNPQGSNNSLAYGYAYSPAGKKTRLTWADGTEIGYSYAAHGELESVSIPGEGSISINQFTWTAPAKITYPGGSTLTSSHTGLLQPRSQQLKTPAQQTTLSQHFDWGKLLELQLVKRSQSAAGNTRSLDSAYTYDDELRLTQVDTDTGGLFGSNTESFVLDGVANRTAHSKVSGEWTYDANNRLLTRGTSGTNSATYQYDDNGNLTQKTEGAKVTRYAYDTLNRLTEVWDASQTGSATNPAKLIARYGYDPMSRRIWKEQYRAKDGTLLTQATRTLYLYADEGLIAEATQAITLNTADNSVAASTTDAPAITTQYGPKPDAPFTTGMLFVKTKNSNGQDTIAYYQHDHLQTPIQAIDKTGRVVWAAEYNAFGEATIITPAATADNPTIVSNLRFPGQYLDGETGLHYNHHRYYDPTIGRYTGADPIGLRGGINRYGYVGANPVGLFDPHGLSVYRGPGNSFSGIPPSSGACEKAVWKGGYIMGWVPCDIPKVRDPNCSPKDNKPSSGGSGGSPSSPPPPNRPPEPSFEDRWNAHFNPPCPGGVWDQDVGDFSISVAAGGYLSVARVNLRCRSNGSVKAKGFQYCFGGGAIFGGGIAWSAAGVVSGADSKSALNSGLSNSGVAALGVGMGANAQTDLNGNESVSAGPSIGGGGAYVACQSIF